MTDLTNLLAPFKARVKSAIAAEVTFNGDSLDQDYIRALEASTEDVPRLLGALDGAESALARYAAAMDETSKRLNQQVLDRDIHRDPEAAIRYSNYASAADVALRNFRAAVVAALGEGA